MVHRNVHTTSLIRFLRACLDVRISYKLNHIISKPSSVQIKKCHRNFTHSHTNARIIRRKIKETYVGFGFYQRWRTDVDGEEQRNNNTYNFTITNVCLYDMLAESSFCSHCWTMCLWTVFCVCARFHFAFFSLSFSSFLSQRRYYGIIYLARFFFLLLMRLHC